MSFIQQGILASAGMGAIDPLLVSALYQASSNGSPRTFSNVPIGSPRSDRWLIVLVGLGLTSFVGSSWVSRIAVNVGGSFVGNAEIINQTRTGYNNQEPLAIGLIHVPEGEIANFTIHDDADNKSLNCSLSVIAHYGEPNLIWSQSGTRGVDRTVTAKLGSTGEAWVAALGIGPTSSGSVLTGITTVQSPFGAGGFSDKYSSIGFQRMTGAPHDEVSVSVAEGSIGVACFEKKHDLEETLYVAGELYYRFLPELDAYSDDAGTVAAVEGDGIAVLGNQGTGPSNGVQTTAIRRPTFREAGLNGRPYLECGGSLNPQWFNDLTFSIASGLTTIEPFTAFWATDAIDDLSGNPALFALPGHSDGGKVCVYFRSPANAQIHWFKINMHIGNVINPMYGWVRPTGTTTGEGHVWGDDFEKFASANLYDNSSATINFLRGTGLPGGGFFKGHLYELIIVRGYLNYEKRLHVTRYLRHRYGFPKQLGNIVAPTITVTEG